MMAMKMPGFHSRRVFEESEIAPETVTLCYFLRAVKANRRCRSETWTRPFFASNALPAGISMHFVLFITGWYLFLSIAAFAAYAVDKAAAGRGDARIAERTLHILGLAGGWPGAIMAQSMLRHKSRKRTFRAVFWLTVVLNCGLLAAAMAMPTIWHPSSAA
jgi:uncharacterized membrane protein YsdA (DUF1294 family)